MMTGSERLGRLELGPWARAWELLWLLTARELKLRYQGTALGFLWSLAKPLLQGLVIYFALSRVLRVGIPNYHIFLLSALFPWAWFQTSILLGTPAFVNNANLLKKVFFPRFVLPLSIVLHNLLNFLLSLPVLMLLLMLVGLRPGPQWVLGLPLLVAVELLLLAGIVLLLASLNVFLRDLEHLVEVFLNLWFYVTPILYPLSLVPGKVKAIMLLNPLTTLIEAWRGLFMENALPGWELWPALLFAAVALVLGTVAFRTLEERFEDAL